MVLPSECDRVRVSASASRVISGMSKLKLRVFITVSSSSSFWRSLSIFSFFTKGKPPYSGERSSIDRYCFVLRVITSFGLFFGTFPVSFVTTLHEGTADGSQLSRTIAAFLSLLQGGSVFSLSLTALSLLDGSFSGVSLGALLCSFSLSLKEILFDVITVFKVDDAVDVRGGGSRPEMDGLWSACVVGGGLIG